MFFDRSVAALDFGSRNIACIIGSKQSDEIAIAGAGICEYGGFRGDKWREPNKIGSGVITALRQAEKAAGKRTRDVYVAVPGEYSYVWVERIQMVLGTGTVTNKDYTALMKMVGREQLPQGSKLLHMHTISWSLDGAGVTGSIIGRKGGVLTGYFTCVAGDIKFMHSVESLLEQVGIGVIRFVCTPFSTAKMLSDLSLKSRNVMIMNIGYYNTDIMIIQQDALIYHNNFEPGGGHILSDIAVNLDVDLTIAEQIRTRTAVGRVLNEDLVHINTVNTDKGLFRYDPVLVQRICEKRLHEIFEMAKGSLHNVNIHMGDPLDVYLTGSALATLRGMKDYFTIVFGSLVHEYIPRGSMAASPIYTNVVGVCRWALENRNKSKFRL